jgi:hypothetical protein
LFPAYFPQFKEKARVNVEDKIWGQSNERVEALYPNYNPYAKEEIVKELFKQQVSNKAIFKKEVDKEYKELIDQYQDKDGQTYLLELDPYHWMRYTANVLKNGHPGDRQEGKKIYDEYMLAPLGSSISYVRLLFYLSAFLYNVFVFFVKGTSLSTFTFYLPLFYAAIFLVVVYFFSKRIFSPAAAFFTTLFVGLNNVFLQRSCAGWFDYDTLSLLVPVLITWFLLEALRNNNNVKKVIVFSLLAAFFQGVYPVVWIGWWFIFLVAGGFFFCSILNNYLIYQNDFKKANRETKHYFISAIVFIVFSVIFILLFARLDLARTIFVAIRDNLNLGKSVSASIWPNTYYTVGELTSVNLAKLDDYLYGKIIFLLSLLSMFWVYAKERRGSRKDFFYIMFFWFLFMLFASLKSIRFTMFLALPLGFFMGAFIIDVWRQVRSKFVSNFKVRISMISVVALLIIFILRTFIFTGVAAAKYIYPLMNDDWQKVLTHIKDNTPGDAIINSWWDYGDWYKTVGERRVIFDGQSQHRPLAYWMARVLLSSDEEKSLRLLKMVNNASDRTFPKLNRHITDPFECAAVLDKLFSLNRSEGKSLLLGRGVGDKAVDKILDDLHNKPATAYFLVEESLLGKMGNISFLGNWDFKKLYVYRNLSKPKEEVLANLSRIFGISLEVAKQYYDEIVITPRDDSIYEALSDRVSFYSKVDEGRLEGDSLYFDNGLVFDKVAEKGAVYSRRDKKYKTVKNMFVSYEDREKEIENEEGDFNKSVLLFEIDDKYKSIVLDSPLEKSLFSRLYFLRGRGLKYFEPFIIDDEAKIYVYKINWESLK